MPKSNPTSPSLNAQTKHGFDDPPSRISDIALRKKKNADAQAAFRARRANYIATLEETVTSLESVVLQLQESCRESRNEVQDLRQENSRLRHQFKEREKFWRALWQSRKNAQGLESDDLPPPPPPPPPSFSGTQPHSESIGAQGTPHIPHYGNDNMTYRTTDNPPICQAPYTTASNIPSYHSTHPLPYGSGEGQISGEGVSHSVNQRSATKFSQYPYTVPEAPRDGRWQGSVISHGGTSSSEAAVMTNSQSPGYPEPNTTSSDMTYVPRYPAEEQKLVNSLDNAPYVFPASGDRFSNGIPTSRSLSPTTSTPGSSSSTSLTSSFQFTFPDGAVGNPVGQDNTDFDYRRHSLSHGEVTLHGGTADLSLPASADAVRYRLGSRRLQLSPTDRSLLHILPPLSGSDTGSQHERGSSDGDITPYSHSQSQSHQRLRRSAVSSRHSRSPSPGSTPISCTVAVIKAQAFGALRRTRAQTKKSSEGALKVAKHVLEARGIGMAVSAGSKRPRLHDDEDDE